MWSPCLEAMSSNHWVPLPVLQAPTLFPRSESLLQLLQSCLQPLPPPGLHCTREHQRPVPGWEQRTLPPGGSCCIETEPRGSQLDTAVGKSRLQPEARGTWWLWAGAAPHFFGTKLASCSQAAPVGPGTGTARLWRACPLPERPQPLPPYTFITRP